MKVAVMMGGVSAERDVSMRSGKAIASGLRKEGHTVYEAVVIDRSLRSLSSFPCDAVFVALHGEFGEDGEVQSLLEAREIPYTGSGPEASRVAMNKLLTKESFSGSRVPSPRHVAFSRGDRATCVDAIMGTLGLPVVVKPACQGSSIGVTIVEERAALDGAVDDALSFGSEGLAEAFVRGKELHVGILGGDALPIIWVKPGRDFYDYEAKYGNAGTEYICPAPLDTALEQQVKETACRAFRSVGCRHLGRVDVILGDDGGPLVLEVNTIPGFTETSLLPKAAGAAGIGFSALCDRIVHMAWEG